MLNKNVMILTGKYTGAAGVVEAVKNGGVYVRIVGVVGGVEVNVLQRYAAKSLEVFI